jgi:flagellar hook assembly protein FlgD
VIRFDWDGTDDDGQMLPRGRYVARARVTRPHGSYGHDVTVRMQPFQLVTPKWTLRRGETAKLTILTAEPVKGKVAVTANQKGVKRWQLKVRKVSATKFTARVTTRKGKGTSPGYLKIRVVSTDQGGGTQAQLFKLKLR